MERMEEIIEMLKHKPPLDQIDETKFAYVLSAIVVGVFTLVFYLCYCICHKKDTSKKTVKLGGPGQNLELSSSSASNSSSSSNIRMRKRDKVASLTKKMFKKLPKMQDDPTKTVSTFFKDRAKSLHEIQKVLEQRGTKTLESARKLVLGESDTQPDRIIRGPPTSVLEASIADSDHRIPSELKNMLASVRVFGNFEQPIFLELCKQVTSVYYPGGSLLRDLDQSFYVIQSGEISVFMEEAGEKQYIIKKSHHGDSIFSLLSILDVITSTDAPFKTHVFALCEADCYLLKLPLTVFSTIHNQNQEAMLRFIQVILLRLSRVTYLALYKYLGLTKELVEKDVVLPDLAVHSLTSCRRSKAKAKEKRSVFRRKRSNTNNSTGDECDPKSAAECTDTEISDTQFNMDTKSTLSNNITTVNDSDIKNVAVSDLSNILGLEDKKALENKVTLIHMTKGSVICQQGDVEKFLTFIATGYLEVTQHCVHEDADVLLYNASAGEIVGIMSILTGDPSQVTVTAPRRSILLTIPSHEVIRLVRQYPVCLLKLIQHLTKRISVFVRQMDYALEWIAMEAGRALYKQGEASHGSYIVLSGRLRSVLEHEDGRKELISEFGRGDTIGVVEFATGATRTMTVLAVRDSELGKLPEGLLNTIKFMHPKTVSRLISLLGHQILGQYKQKPRFGHQLSNANVQQSPNTNLSTVALLPGSKNVPLSAFANALSEAINTIGPCKRLTSSIIVKQLGHDALSSVYECQLTNHLNSIEDQNRIVLYQADNDMSMWTHQCIRQADVILIVARASENPEQCTAVEVALNSMNVRAQKELILLHPSTAKEPRDTVRWLNARGWISSHLHIRCPDYILDDTPQYSTAYNPHSDLARIARRLTGTSIGVVLGGGGARGISHIGILQSLEDHGIPIDFIGGTSIGSLMGALYADDTNVCNMRERAARFSADMSKMWKKILELTYPYTSMFSGYGFNKGIHAIFENKNIEDLWIPYFCVTTDVTSSEMRVHTQGCLWRYVRASMTLSGYLPPMCDPVDGHLLVDGGYINNLPADIMSQRMGAQTIIAVDVGGQSDNEFDNYGDALSGWWVLWNKYFPLVRTLRIPNMAEIQTRLAYVSSERQLAQVSSMENCYYIRPPIDRIGTLQFGSFDDIEEIGYRHGTGVVSAWVKGGIVSSDMLAEHKAGLDRVTGPSKLYLSQESDYDDEFRKKAPSPFASFTDIAAAVSRIEEPPRQDPRSPAFRRQLSWPAQVVSRHFSDSDSSETSEDVPSISALKDTSGFYSDSDIPNVLSEKQYMKPSKSEEVFKLGKSV